MDIDASLPGADLIETGVRSYVRGETTAQSLLVAIGRPRLSDLGIDLPAQRALFSEPELQLYRLLAADHGAGAHSQYNALIRRLTSFERAAARTRAAGPRRGLTGWGPPRNLIPR